MDVLSLTRGLHPERIRTPSPDPQIDSGLEFIRIGQDYTGYICFIRNLAGPHIGEITSKS